MRLTYFVPSGLSIMALLLVANGLQLRAWGADDAGGPAPAPAPTPAPEPAPVTPPAPPSGAESQAQKLLDEQASNDKKLREEIAAQASAHLESAVAAISK